MSSKIEPCPFCACEVTFLTGREDYRISGKHAKTCPFVDVDVVVDSREAWNTRAAPVVERQPVAYQKPVDYWEGYGYIDRSCHIELRKMVDHLENLLDEVPYGPLYTAPPELAELQATIANLTTELKVTKQALESLKGERDELQSEIERLKGGQGEPVGYVHQWEIDRISKGQAHWATFWKSDGTNNPSRNGSPAIPLYASQSAPVSVAQQCKIGIYGKAYDAPETKRAYTYAEQPDNMAASKLGKAAFFAKPGGDSIDYGLSLLKALADEGFGVFEIDACLDKAKELNQ